MSFGRYERYGTYDRDTPSEISHVDTEMDNIITEKITVTFNINKDKLAAAYFDTLTHKIYVMQDTSDSPNYDLAMSILHQLQPDEIYCSLTATDGLIKAIELFIANVKPDAVLQLTPWKEFSYEGSKSRILQLRISGDSHLEHASQPSWVNPLGQMESDTMDSRLKEIYLSGFINFDCRLSVGAVGCLILTLQRHIAQDSATAITSASCRVEDLDLSGLETWQIDKVMQIDNDALMALSVFSNEQHASIHSNKSKEGLSLFNLLSETKTHVGTQLLQRRLRQPSCDIGIINNRLDAIAILIHPQNVSAVKDMRLSLSKVGKGVNVMHVLNSMKSGKTSVRSFKGLVNLAILAEELYDGIAALAVLESKQLITDILKAFDISICHTVKNIITSTIDFNESKAEHRLIITAGLDDELDNLRQQFNELDSFLVHVAQQIHEETPPNIANEIDVVYFPQIGYLIALDIANNGYGDVEKRDMIGVGIGWEYQYVVHDRNGTVCNDMSCVRNSFPQTLYFKSDRMRELDNHLGDMATLIADRETEIIYELTQHVLSYSNELSTMAENISELDVLLAMTHVSEVHRFSKPLMTDTPIIRISNGRHPLQELCVGTFVQNDTQLKKSVEMRVKVDDDIDIIESRNITPFSVVAPMTSTKQSSGILSNGVHKEMQDTTHSTMIITGANGSGKSVYLKQVGLIVILAQIGCYVPAESATLGIIDKLFTRVMCKESSSKMQSAFMIDLAQVTHAMRNATGRSLVLWDEFGKGTLPSDGAGMFAASINYLMRRGDNCPFIIATTHFNDLWENCCIKLAASVVIAHMRVKTSKNDEGNFTLTHLHKLELELSKDSGAFDCALSNNIPIDIVDKARHISQLYLLNTLDELAADTLDEDPTEELLDAQDITRRFLEWDIEEAYSHNHSSSTIKEYLVDDILSHE